MAFTEDMNELERTVQRLEKEELPLEEALDLYEDGLGLVRRCSAFLRDAEQRIEVLDEDGTWKRWTEEERP